MKKISMMLVGALFALGASAQTFTNGEWRLDKTYTTTGDGTFKSEELMEYNDAGQISVINGREDNGGTVMETKAVYTYNDKGQLESQVLYQKNGSDLKELSRSEITEYYDSGLPKVIESTGPQAGYAQLGDIKTRTVITKYHGTQFEEEEVYLWMGTEWTKNATVTATFNSSDQMAKMVTAMSYMGYEMTTETEYEYDSHNNVTKESTTSMGMTTVTTMKNEYDDNGNLVKVTTDASGDITISEHFWSRSGTSGIGSRVKVGEGASQWFDLNGRRLMGKPTRQGIYIRDGKKFIVK